MLEIRQTAAFERWLSRLRDPTARAKILVRLRRLAFGNPGDVRPVGGGVSELRIDYGPGYRVYFTQRGEVLILVLCGGDKRTQQRDIARAISMAGGLEAGGLEAGGLEAGGLEAGGLEAGGLEAGGLED